MAAAAVSDADGLVAFVDQTCWAKLALERSPQSELTVVSIVTVGLSDDCNSAAIIR